MRSNVHTTGQQHGLNQLCIKQQNDHCLQMEGVWAQVIHNLEELKRKGLHWLLNNIDMMDEEINAEIFGN